MSDQPQLTIEEMQKVAGALEQTSQVSAYLLLVQKLQQYHADQQAKGSGANPTVQAPPKPNGRVEKASP